MTLSSKIISPRHLRQNILIKYHKGICGGHLGFTKTFVKLKEGFYWPRMKEEAKLACANCVRCGASKITTHALKGTLTSMAAEFPFERIAMDIVGKLPKTIRNNRYMLVVIDYNTR